MPKFMTDRREAWPIVELIAAIIAALASCGCGAAGPYVPTGPQAAAYVVCDARAQERFDLECRGAPALECPWLEDILSDLQKCQEAAPR